MTLFECGCCKEQYPIIHRHIHHKNPRSTGGTNDADNLIALCSGCHDALHSIASMLLNKRTPIQRVYDTLAALYKENREAQKNCLNLAVLVRDATIVMSESSLSPDHLVTVAVTLRKQHKDAMLLHCQSAGLSMEKFLRMLIFRELSSVYPAIFNTNPLFEAELITKLKKGKVGMR